MIKDVIIHYWSIGSRDGKAVVKVLPGSPVLPKLFAPDQDAARRFIEFFTANIRNSNTRRAYARAAVEFAVWCEKNGILELLDIEPFHIATYIEALQTRLAPPSVKQHLLLYGCCLTGSWWAKLSLSTRQVRFEARNILRSRRAKQPSCQPKSPGNS